MRPIVCQATLSSLCRMITTQLSICPTIDHALRSRDKMWSENQLLRRPSITTMHTSSMTPRLRRVNLKKAKLSKTVTVGWVLGRPLLILVENLETFSTVSQWCKVGWWPAKMRKAKPPAASISSSQRKVTKKVAVASKIHLDSRASRSSASYRQSLSQIS